MRKCFFRLSCRYQEYQRRGDLLYQGGTDNRKRGKYFRSSKTDRQWSIRGSAILLHHRKIIETGQHRKQQHEQHVGQPEQIHSHAIEPALPHYGTPAHLTTPLPCTRARRSHTRPHTPRRRPRPASRTARNDARRRRPPRPSPWRSSIRGGLTG